MKQVFILSMMVAVSYHPLFATTYYVSNTGSDSGNGLSLADPFETLQHASNMTDPGDSVWVLPGEYTGFYHATSGTQLDRIVFHAEPGANITQPNEITDDGINLEGASYITIEGFTVTGVPRAGIRSVINEHIIIQHNTCTQNGVWGILTGYSENIIIQYNTCSFSQDEHGIYFGNSADNPIIRYNVCHDNNANGIHMNADANLDGDGIISNASVTNNILYNNGIAGGSAINCDGVQNSYIANNLIYNNHASGISLYRIDAAEPCHGTVVVNNTILQPADGRWALNITNGGEDIIVFNNILLSEHVFRGSITADAISLETLQSNNNITTDRMSVDDGDSVISLSDWQTETDNDDDSFISSANLIFTDAGNNEYTLSESSTALDAGLASLGAVAAPQADLVDALRPQAEGWDIGCYEGLTVENIAQLPSVAAMSWYAVPASAEVWLYDMSGRLVAHNFKQQLQNNNLPERDQHLLFVVRLPGNTLATGKLPLLQR